MPKINIRFTVAIIVGGVLSFISFRESASHALSDNAPALAVQISPGNEIAGQRLANILMKDFNNDNALDKAAIIVERNLRTAPGQPALLRNYAILADKKRFDGDPVAIMKLAASLSKRDLPAQLWMIEREVAKGNVESTLTHYDNVLRSNPATYPVLFPVLGKALLDPTLIGPIVKMLKKRPAWANSFYVSFSTDKDIATNFPLLIDAFGDKADEYIPGGIRTSVSQTLAEMGNLDKAEKVALLGKTNGNFSDFGNNNGTIQPPFGWQLIPSGTIGTKTNEKGQLLIDIDRGDGGVIAVRTFRIPALNFQIRANFYTSLAKIERLPILLVSCATTGTNLQKVEPKLTGKDSFTLTQSISMPNCQFATLQIQMPSNFNGVSFTIKSNEVSVQ